MAATTRLSKAHGPQIKESLKVLGFAVTSRPYQRDGSAEALPTAIYVYVPPRDHRSYLGCVRWVPNMGWRMELVLPVLNTEEELDLAMGQLKGTRATLKEAGGTWNKYKKSKSQRNWAEHLGVLAAYYTGGMQ